MQKPRFFSQHKDTWFTLLFALLACSVPFITKNDYYIHIACMVGINILIALGMHAVTGLAGQINMGQYGFYCIGAYTCAIIMTKTGLGFIPTLLIVIAISAVFGILVGLPSLRIDGPYLALATIGFAESVRLIINSAAWAGKADGIIRIPKLDFFGLEATTKTQSYFFILAIVLVCIIVVNNLMRSNFGNRFKAIKDDPLIASVMGINVTSVKLLAFMISAIFGGIAGALYASFASYINPTTFIQALQTNFMLMVVLGGLGISWGATLGAVLVTVIFEYTRVYVLYQKIAFGVMMILIVLFLNRGIIGTITHYFQQRAILRQHTQESNLDTLR
ncbi:MAG: branched-chain amino acid ABC transporter permease [Anaerolineales bacterium]|nr:MAG: branched-chain amino acid ABC transporter permease [Anaerolineales bacterium]